MKPWILLELSAEESGGLRVSAPAAVGGRALPPQPLPGIHRRHVEAFARAVARQSQRGAELTAEQRDWVRQLHGALFQGPVGQLCDQLRGQGPLHLRLQCGDPALRAVPWEAMAGPTPADGPIGARLALRVSRTIYATEPVVAREVRGAVRVLAVCAAEMAGMLTDLSASLRPLTESGQVEWLPPCVGPRWPALFQRLQQTPRPHVLHLLCHGRVREGRTELQLDPNPELWLPVEVLAAALQGPVGEELRLVYLESCAGADPAAGASAAELLTARGPAAAVAHLWPVSAAGARTAAQAFYLALATSAAGDVAAALTQSRIALAGAGSAEALCPVLFLRGPDPCLFDFQRRALAAPRRVQAGPAATLTPAQVALAAQLRATLAAPRSLVLGESPPETRPLEATLRRLLDEPGQPPLLHLMQRFELCEEREELKAVVQEVLDPLSQGEDSAAPPLIDDLMALAGPGLVVTLGWLPGVESALAAHHPHRELLVFQPPRPGALDRLWTFRRGPGERAWTRLRAAPAEVDFREQIVVLRLFGGYAAPSRTLLGEPILTEDDQSATLEDIERLPVELLAHLRHHPLLVVGLSAWAWGHRELLRRLSGGQPLAPGSLVALPPQADPGERRYWESPRGPGGRAGAVSVLAREDFMAVVSALRGEA